MNRALRGILNFKSHLIIVYKFVYNYKGKIIEGTCIAKKGVVKLSDAWVKTIGL